MAHVAEGVVLRAAGADFMSAETAERVRRVITGHQRVARRFRIGAAEILLLGVELLQIKRVVGHGRFEKVQSDCLEPHGVSARTARRYMNLARAGLRKMAEVKGKPFDYSKALGAGLDQEEETLRAALAEATDGETWLELLESFSVLRSQVQQRGGFHPPRELIEAFARLNGLEAGNYADWPEEVRLKFRAWAAEEKRREEAKHPHALEDRRRRAAERNWRPFLQQAAIGLRRRDALVLLPKEQRKTLRHTLQELISAIDETL